MIKQFNTKSRRRAEDIDRHVSARMRKRRIFLGLSRRQMAALIGVTIQQTYKYERGANRVASGRLHRIAQALDVDVGYFFEGLGMDDAPRRTQQQQLMLELARSFIAIPIRKHKEGIVQLARDLAEPDSGPLAVRGARRRLVWPG